jgi:hypothetical protein
MTMGQALHLVPYTAITLASLNAEKNFLEQILLASPELQPRKVNKPIVLYGAGSLGKMAKAFFSHLKIPFMYVLDRNASEYKSDECWRDSRVIHPDDVAAEDKKNALLVICIVTIPLIQLQNELKAAGWQDIAFFYDVSEAYTDRHPISNGWFLDKLSDRDKELIRKVYASLNDDVSRMHYLQFLAWRRLRVELLFENIVINPSNRFFIPEITNILNDCEVFVDCGAHKGSVMRKFWEIVKGVYKDIYAIEPDMANATSCKAMVKDISRITMIECALGERTGEGGFYQGFDHASKLGTTGKAKVRIMALDVKRCGAHNTEMPADYGSNDIS